MRRLLQIIGRVFRSMTKGPGPETAPNPIDGTPNEYVQRVWDRYKETRLSEDK